MVALKNSFLLILILILLGISACTQNKSTDEKTDRAWENSVTQYLTKFNKEKLSKTSPDEIWVLYLKDQNRLEPYGSSETEIDEYMKNCYYPYTKTLLEHSPTYDRDYGYIYTILSNYNKYVARAVGGGTGFGHYEERLPGEINWIILNKSLQKEDITVPLLITKIKEKYGTEPTFPYDKDAFESREKYEKIKADERKEMEDELQLINLNLRKIKAEAPDLYLKIAEYIANYYQFN